MTKRTPRWITPFLRALERTGSVRAAAVDAGIDHTSAYARRQAHAEFRAAWEAALRAHQARVAEEQRAAVAAANPSTVFDGPPPELGEDVVISAGQVKRAGSGRWTQAAERRFFAALADTANVKLAARAAGFSTTAVYARRLRHLAFREQWAAAVDTARARLDLYLIEAANNAFENGVAGVPAKAPQVSVNEALHILKLGAEPRSPDAAHGRRLGARLPANGGLASDAEVRAALVKSLRAFGVRLTAEEIRGERRRD